AALSTRLLLRSRDLVWDGCLNVRDLGGHPTDDGGETRFDSVVRADSVRQLSDDGWRALVEYGVRTVVDLRSDEELAADPPAELPVDAVHVPFFDDRADVFDAVEAASTGAASHAEATRAVYLIFLEHFRANVAAAIRAVATAPEGGVVVHCHGGKDRTGLVSAFLLRLAGVPIDAIATDYALSEERLRTRHEQWFAEAADEAELERLHRIAATPASSMKQVLEELERRYGSIEGYLRAGGVTDEELRQARARLRD
ncbi:MAG TPA: tyrosine-protein phosphatase, partial [Gaiellaceae bacterium]|nr:tyrosine-protein phosphatase [Gaiellaceae bacterium]